MKLVDFGYTEGDVEANMEKNTRKRLAVRYVAVKERYPFLYSTSRLVLVPTPQELRLYRAVLEDSYPSVNLQCARVYRRLKYVSSEDEAKVEAAPREPV
ncbi:hypothetical protein KM540_gp075 [Western grey kangaroopox virus]|uniref:Uncharacterized protein n=2 Tax=Macropopoxvirus TaxID=2733295 RepID=A0A2C9DT37_9POXV|nr:hypothetical protein KM540_gp075 [Western grey kangaroopox virus]YP_010085360.1 hypothetical protein KM541_gp074 [Eastern grey kangaroopox virus]ATI21006.1 hypothetical protein [Western grey kangaroopox virus]ATI21170.1 hypothetical protein [Eastern grey kangaroopox virus]AXK50173.1 hypothetical protein EKPV-NSW-ORF087 [Eastern grey kangaroopox virus]